MYVWDFTGENQCYSVIALMRHLPDLDLRTVMRSLGGIRGQVSRLENTVKDIATCLGQFQHFAQVLQCFLGVFLIMQRCHFQKANLDAASQEEVDMNNEDLLGSPWTSTAQAENLFGDKRKEKVCAFILIVSAVFPKVSLTRN